MTHTFAPMTERASFQLLLDETLREPGDWMICRSGISGRMVVDGRRWAYRDRAAAQAALEEFRRAAGMAGVVA